MEESFIIFVEKNHLSLIIVCDVEYTVCNLGAVLKGKFCEIPISKLFAGYCAI
jgi:hypothetical protein